MTKPAQHPKTGRSPVLWPVGVGLTTAQAVACGHLYLANTHLARQMAAVADAGYLAVPNAQVTARLGQLGTAVGGGLFFTLTVGAALTLVALMAAWLWRRFGSRRLAGLLAMLWLTPVVFLNTGGWLPGPSAYFLLIPPLTFTAALKASRKPPVRRPRGGLAIHLACLALLALMWSTQAGGRMFIDIRDYLLLSNPVGDRINAFYYRYTLFPAETFKSAGQKLIRTCRIGPFSLPEMKNRVERTLRQRDYLAVDPAVPALLDISETEGILTLAHDGRRIWQGRIGEFVSRPGPVLEAFSKKTDRHSLFRKFTFISLLLAFPVLLYLVFSELVRSLTVRFWNERGACIAAAVVCLVSGTGLLVPVYLGSAVDAERDRLDAALGSTRRAERLAALRYIADNRLEIARYPAYQRLVSKAGAAERYWLVKALGESRKTETYPLILGYLDDPHPNVVCQAFYALGRRGDRQAVKPILAHIEHSTHWYCQWYAYKTLRRLGWHQAQSRQRSF